MSEMEKTAVISSLLEIIGLLVVPPTVPVFASVPVGAVAPTVPVFANVSVGSEAPWGNQHAWNTMYEAYENGDWEVLAQAAMG